MHQHAFDQNVSDNIGIHPVSVCVSWGFLLFLSQACQLHQKHKPLLLRLPATASAFTGSPEDRSQYQWTALLLLWQACGRRRSQSKRWRLGCSRGMGVTGEKALGGSAVRHRRRGPEHPQCSGGTERGPGLGQERTQAAQVRSFTVLIRNQCGTTSKKKHIAGKQEHIRQKWCPKPKCPL